MQEIKFIDLFAGMGGIRCGLEQSIKSLGMRPHCVLTSEIKNHARDVLSQNYPGEFINGDISLIDSKDIPDFDILLAGFPCQAFSNAGKRLGFVDTRGTLFFEVERILKEKRPAGFLLENVEGLVSHDKGNTLKVIIDHLEDIGYKVSFKVLNSKNFGVAQERKRIYIVGAFNNSVCLDFADNKITKVKDILESGLPTSNSAFVLNLLDKFSLEDLYGKSIKDKRGGSNNIHSWDLELKGSLCEEQKKLLNRLMTERRKKKWAEEIGIDWMDGMPLTTSQISSFYYADNLQEMLDDLESKGYLKLEFPKRKVSSITERGVLSSRVSDDTKKKGYNIVTGKLSFEVSKILDPNDIAPTLVAMDMNKIFVGDNGGLRQLSLKEGLRLFGYPDDYKFDVSQSNGFDLLGNTVVVPVIKEVASRLITAIFTTEEHLIDDVLQPIRYVG